MDAFRIIALVEGKESAAFIYKRNQILAGQQ